MARRYTVRDLPRECVVPSMPVQLFKEGSMKPVRSQWHVRCDTCGGTSSLFSAIRSGSRGLIQRTFIVGYCLPHSFAIRDRLCGWEDLIGEAVARSVMSS